MLAPPLACWVTLPSIWRNPVGMVTRSGATIIATLSAAFLVVAGVGGARAQLDLPPLFPTTSTTAPPGVTAPPSTTTTTAAASSVVGGLLKVPIAPAPSTAPPPPTAAAKVAPKAAPTPIPGNAGGEGVPPPDAGPFPPELAAMMNSVRRTGSNNSNTLVDALKMLTDAGMPPDEAMRVGMGRFPVAGRSNYSHDWWYPRFGPGWRLHQGTDVFAERGTPLRSPATGVVSFSDGGLGGISVYITQSDGTYFYLAHLNNRPEGLKPGQTVNTGDIVGYVGSTGNAAGGSPHLHFEVHPAIRFVTVGKGRKATTKAVSHPVRPGTVLPAIDPKPLLDLYLHEALAALPAIAANWQANHAATATVATPAVPVDSDAIALAGRHLAVGGLIAAEAPLVRTPLLLLAFLLIVMVLVLFPVLAPKPRSVGPSPGRHAAEKRARKSSGRRSPKAPPSPVGNGTSPATAAGPTKAGDTGNGGAATPRRRLELRPRGKRKVRAAAPP